MKRSQRSIIMSKQDTKIVKKYMNSKFDEVIMSRLKQELSLEEDTKK